MHAQTDRQAHTHPITPPTSLTHHSNLLTLTHPLARTHVIPGLFAESIPACRLKEPPPQGKAVPLCAPQHASTGSGEGVLFGLQLLFGFSNHWMEEGSQRGLSLLLYCTHLLLMSENQGYFHCEAGKPQPLHYMKLHDRIAHNNLTEDGCSYNADRQYILYTVCHQM